MPLRLLRGMTYRHTMPRAKIAISLDEDDTLGWVRLTTGENDLIVVTERGQALRFHEDEVRAMGRPAAGVTAIRLREGDAITSMDVVDPDADLLVVTVNGFGKRTPLSEYPVYGRGVGGVTTIDQSKADETGPIASARIVYDDDDLTIISTGGTAIRTKMSEIRRAGRATMGTRVINLKNGDSVASVARTAARDLELAEAGEPGPDGAQPQRDEPGPNGAEPQPAAETVPEPA